MKEIELNDVSKILNKEWLIENVDLFTKHRSPTEIVLSQVANWKYFDEEHFEIKDLIFDSIYVYAFENGKEDYVFFNDNKDVGNGFQTFSPTTTELKKKLLLEIRDRIDEINNERIELLERMENICEL